MVAPDPFALQFPSLIIQEEAMKTQRRFTHGTADVKRLSLPVE
jgi:hypothetical protein